MKTKFILLIVGVLIVGLVFLNSIEQPQEIKLNCENPPDIYFLKHSEISSIQPILNSNPNALIVIPEDNSIRANTELLNCPGLDLMSYLGGSK